VGVWYLRVDGARLLWFVYPPWSPGTRARKDHNPPPPPRLTTPEPCQTGEPGGWPHISSRFGQFDLAGFAKAPAAWFQARWLTSVPTADAGRPPLALATTVRIVELWQAPNNAAKYCAAGQACRRINVYSNAPIVRVSVNGGAPAYLAGANGVFSGTVLYADGVLLAEALAADNATVLASHTRASWGAPAALALSVDAPSPASGTGGALYLDGMDVALVRATVLDARGNVVGDAALNVTFSVAAGPGVVVGVGNGDPSCLAPNQVAWRDTYHGLARAVVRATLDAATPDAVRARRIAMEVDAGKGHRSSSSMPLGGTPPRALTVTATARGLPPASLDIPLSVDPKDAPLAVAAASVGTADLGVNI
jgi:hypothetical protein